MIAAKAARPAHRPAAELHDKRPELERRAALATRCPPPVVRRSPIGGPSCAAKG